MKQKKEILFITRCELTYIHKECIFKLWGLDDNDKVYTMYILYPASNSHIRALASIDKWVYITYHIDANNNYIIDEISKI